MIARALDEATDSIRHKRRRALESTVLAAGCAVLAWQALGSASLALALAAGAGFELLITAWALLSRAAERYDPSLAATARDRMRELAPPVRR